MLSLDLIETQQLATRPSTWHSCGAVPPPPLRFAPQGRKRSRRELLASMTTPRVIPDLVRNTQGRAAEPKVSAFVSANAGAGKTQVLVQRVIRILLTNTPPEKILCITFTKAAAANMAERVFSTLSDWIGLDDAALDAKLRETGIAWPDGRLRKRARELFARALETPGGLKVQTIHALCGCCCSSFRSRPTV